MQESHSTKSVPIRNIDKYYTMSNLLYSLRDLGIKSAFPAASRAWNLYIQELMAE